MKTFALGGRPDWESEMNHVADGGGALSKDELIDTIQKTLTECHTKAQQGEKLPNVARSSFGGADSGQVLGFHTGEAHGHVVDGMTKLAAGLLAFDQSVGKFRKDVADTDDTVSVPFRKATQGMDARGLLGAGEDCTTGANPTDYTDNNQCTLP
jgi:hypothetical protein